MDLANSAAISICCGLLDINKSHVNTSTCHDVVDVLLYSVL